MAKKSMIEREKKRIKLEKKYDLNLSEVQGNIQAKRALEIVFSSTLEAYN